MLTFNKKNRQETNRDKYSRLVEFEQICLTYKQLPGLALIGFTSSTILTFLYWDYVNHKNITILYLVAIFPLTISPLISAYYFKKVKPEIEQINKWAKLLVAVYFIRSCAWGSTGVVLYESHSFINQFALFFTLTVVAVFHVISTAGFKPVFYASIFTLMLPLTFRLIIDFTGASLASSLLIIFLTLLFILFYKKLNNTFQDSLILGHEKTQLASELEKANLDKSRFLAAASHDLRQPLHAQGLYIAELKKIMNDAKSSKIIQSLEKSTSVMRTMFDTLLDISRLDAGVVKPKIQHFPLSKIFDELFLDFSGMALDKDLSFRIVESSIVVKSDPVLLSQIIRNFLSNAIKYTNKGGILLGCRRKSDNTVSIEIWDTGIGISPQEQETIFQEFLQLGNSERDRNKGLGLGLAIVKRLAALLGHPISVQSKLGRGSVFSISVTCGDIEKINPSENTFSDHYIADLKNLSVLVIDDDTSILEAMQWLLEDWGCVVKIVESEDDAIQLINNSNFIPDIIIADYRLRDNKTGVEAIQIINSTLQKNIPGILITGDTSPDRIKEAENSGFKVLHKPLEPDKLRSLLSYYKNIV